MSDSDTEQFTIVEWYKNGEVGIRRVRANQKGLDMHAQQIMEQTDETNPCMVFAVPGWFDDLDVLVNQIKGAGLAAGLSQDVVDKFHLELVGPDAIRKRIQTDVKTPHQN